MNGLLIVNNFIGAGKFSELYDMLICSAKKLNINLSIKRTGEIKHNLDSVKNEYADFVLFWDKDVLLAKMFEICGFKVFNSSSAIFNCDNKGYTFMKLQQSNVLTPETYIAPLTYEGLGYTNLLFADEICSQLGFPIIIKELYGSFGQQVYLVNNKEEMIYVIDKIGHKGFLFQKYIETSKGKDVRINVVGNKVVSSILRYSVNGDFRSNISNGGKMQKYVASSEQKNLAIKSCEALELDFAGVDVMFGPNDEPIICEVNSNPHFKSTFDCTGKDMSLEILKYVISKVE